MNAKEYVKKVQPAGASPASGQDESVQGHADVDFYADAYLSAATAYADAVKKFGRVRIKDFEREEVE